MAHSLPAATPPPPPPRILIIAGSDSSGGAGLEADQKVVALHGCYAMTATTALTAQNTQGVIDILPTPASFVVKQIKACLDDVGADVVKIGMLAGAETAAAVAATLSESYRNRVPIILDPVMVASTGARLLNEDALAVVIEKLVPMATILTPNIPEAKLLLGQDKDPDPWTERGMVLLARQLQGLGARCVLLKGGHLRGLQQMTGQTSPSKVFDVLVGPSESDVLVIEREYICSRNTHGTGCSLASAIASHLARGEDTAEAVRKACYYVEAGIRSAFRLGQGSGPINHFHSSYILPFAPGRFIEYVLARADVGPAWAKYTEHDFVAKMASGTLPMERFQVYMVQDYLFLTQFARAKAIAASKRFSIDDVASEADVIMAIRREMALHVTFGESFGLSRSDMQNAKPLQACYAYSRYILDVANSSDWVALQMVCTPCLIGYGMIAERLYKDENTLKGDENPYWRWVENYVASDYVNDVKTGREIIEKVAVLQSPSRIEELVGYFVTATELETGFWAMAAGVKLMK